MASSSSKTPDGRASGTNGVQLDLDLQPLSSWRRWLPGWIRALVWVDANPTYDAFLSYSWKSDSKVAPLIQSVLQRFLCPWYRVRAKTIFRDLSCLPAGSSLETELFDRLDRSRHLLVLACPEAVHSLGMEVEARYWFARSREGQVLIVVTAGDYNSWLDIREHLLPRSIRDNLTGEPLWIALQHRKDRIIKNSSDPQLREELIEDLKQILLRLYPGQDWGQLRGEERSQRRHAIGLMSGLSLLLLVLAAAAVWFGIYAQRERDQAVLQARIASARQLAAQSKLALGASASANDLAQAAILAIESVDLYHTLEGDQALRQALALLPSRPQKLPFPPGRVAGFSPDGEYLATEGDDGLIHIWRLSNGADVFHLKCPDCTLSLSAGAQFMATPAEGRIEVWVKAKSSYRKTDFSCSIPENYQGEIQTFEVSADGRFVAVGGGDHEDPMAGYLYRPPGRDECDFVEWPGLNMMVQGIAFSSSGDYVAFWGETPGGEGWRPEQAVFRVHRNDNDKVEIDRVIDVGYQANWMAISDAEDEEIPRLAPMSVELAVAGGHDIFVQRGAEELVRLPDNSVRLAIRRDGRALIAVDLNHRAISVWPLSGYRYVQAFKHDYPIDAIGLNSKKLVTITAPDPQTGRARLTEWGIPAGNDLGKSDIEMESQRYFDGENRLTVAVRGGVADWGYLNGLTDGPVYAVGNSIQSLALPPEVTGSDPKLAISANGRRVASVAVDEAKKSSMIKVSTRADNKWVARSKSVPLVVDGVSLSSDGEFLAVVAQSRLFVLDPNTLREIVNSWPNGGATPVSSVAISGTRLVAAGKSDIRVWDWRSKVLISLIDEKEIPIAKLALSSDDLFLGVIENNDNPYLPGPWLARVYSLSHEELLIKACSRLSVFLGNRMPPGACASTPRR